MILLKFPNLWNLINALIKNKFENIYLSVSYDTMINHVHQNHTTLQLKLQNN
jgi:hypothetical protein